MFHRWGNLGAKRLHCIFYSVEKLRRLKIFFSLKTDWCSARVCQPGTHESWDLKEMNVWRGNCVIHTIHTRMWYYNNAQKVKVLHNAQKVKVLHKCTQRRITGMRSRGRRGIKIPHSSDFLTRLTPRPPHHPTPGRVHLVPMHERHLYLGIHIVSILGKCFACRTLFFSE